MVIHTPVYLYSLKRKTILNQNLPMHTNLLQKGFDRSRQAVGNVRPHSFDSFGLNH